MNKKARPNYMLSPRDSFYIYKDGLVINGKKKDIPAKHKKQTNKQKKHENR